MNKKRILWCGESSHIASGFGGYTKEILSRLYATGKYEIAELSSYRDYTVPKTEPWKIYPVAVPPQDPTYAEYSKNEANPYGQWRFDYALIDFKPDIVIDVRDFWNFTFEDTSNFRRFYKWVIAPTYDSSPQKIETINMFKNADRLLFHTDWAKTDLINNFCYNYDNIGPVVNDSVDHSVFKPIGHSKGFHKTKYGIDNNTFIIGSVMRNQKRKLIPDLFSILSDIILKNNKVMLYMHTSYPDSLYWDIPSLLLEYNVHNHVLFTYKCRKCHKNYPSVWRGNRTICKHCKSDSSVICSLRDPVSQKELSDIYNLFDIYIQYAICEGFGIPILEAASCGLPTITIDFGAMGDVGKKLNSRLVPVEREFRETETNAIRCYPNNTICKNYIIDYINMSKSELNRVGKLSRSSAVSSFSWDMTTTKFIEVIDSIDISSNLSWDCDMRGLNASYPITHKNNRQVIYDIVDHVIQEPWLKSTSFIEELIKSSSEKYIMNGHKMTPFNIKDAIKLLELYMNNKNGLEMMRKGITPFPEQLNNFLKYSNNEKQ